LEKARQQCWPASSAGFFDPSCPGWFLSVYNMLELCRACGLDLGAASRVTGDLLADLDPC